jgi:transcriptional regulator with XRE-family HTH domain
MRHVNGGPSGSGSNGRASRDEQALALGMQIRQRREALGVSLRALARDCEMSAAHLSKIERGLSRPSLEMLTRLVQKLELYDLNLFAGVPAVAEGSAA